MNFQRGNCIACFRVVMYQLYIPLRFTHCLNNLMNKPSSDGCSTVMLYGSLGLEVMVEFPALGKEYFVPTRWIEIEEIIGIGYRNLQAGSGIEHLSLGFVQKF